MPETPENVASNLNDLLEAINTSESILRYNTEIEDNIRQNGGTIIYSYNNIIIASEISENFYIELKSSDNIEYIETLPLKKYGDIDTNLIGQIDVSKIFIGQGIDSSGKISSDGTSEYLRGTSGTSEIDGVSGSAVKYVKKW